MRGTLLVYSPNGSLSRKPVGRPTLQLLKDAIGGGYLEVVPYWTSIAEHSGKLVPCVAFCDEDGKRKSLPVNPRATREWDDAMRRAAGCGCAPDYLVGPVLVVTGDQQFLEAL